MTIRELHNKIQHGELSSLTITKDCLNAIERHDSGDYGINAVITINKEEALSLAGLVDEKAKRGETLGLLEGIPLGIKDVLCTKGIRTTAASKILEKYIPPYDATCVKKIKDSGGIIVAKTNCDEFAHGASGENSAYGLTRNPYDLDRVPGGSSSGSGAIVAYGGAVAALGTDTGGSSRAPASFMGLVGLKPTYGRVSRFGLIAMCSSTDTVAPITACVEDAADVLSEIAGKDSRDATSSGITGKNFARDFQRGIKGLKVCYPKQAMQEGLDAKVKDIFFRNLDILKKEGAIVEEISMPLFGDPAVAVYYIIVPSEISSNLTRFDGVLYGSREEKGEALFDMYRNTRTKYLGAETKRRIMLGNYSLSAGYYDAYYKKAQKVRSLIREEAKNIFKKYDLIATPTMATPAFKFGDKSDPLSMYLVDIYSVYANLAGICAVSLNGGWIDNTECKKSVMLKKSVLPVGFQFMAKWWDEETLLRAAYFLEQQVG